MILERNMTTRYYYSRIYVFNVIESVMITLLAGNNGLDKRKSSKRKSVNKKSAKRKIVRRKSLKKKIVDRKSANMKIVDRKSAKRESESSLF
jgi:hypothetical protein